MSRPRRLRALVAAVCVVGQLFAVIHLFARHHVICVEHGDMVHVEGEGAVAARDPARSVTPLHDQGAVLQASTQLRSIHQGDHCSSLTERRALPAAAEVAPRDVPRMLEVASSPSGTSSYSSRDLFRLAPKISPPVAG